MDENVNPNPTPENPTTSTTPPTMGQNYDFTAEIQKLLDILIHSLYTQKEIFLRELISNASDALDKVRFLKLTSKPVRDPDLPLEIHITVDKDKKLLTISDSGIGMTKEELMENIGTIAHSGSKSFIQKLAENKEVSSTMNLIGQFGVGFYSVFMVAKQVEIFTLAAAQEATAWLWTSEGKGSYTIVPTQKETRGTEIRISLKDDASDFLENMRIKNVVQRYSDFVGYSIFLGKDQINKMSAVWHRPAAELKPEDYKAFYNYITHTQDEPQLHLHLAVDAPIQFKGILYVPSTVPWDLMYDAPEHWHGVHLYAKRIFIQADCADLLPAYLRFVRGVVDSDDLPLNISRETLQENNMIAKIKQTLIRKILDKLLEMSKENPDEYKKFWKNFGKFIKSGYRNDPPSRERLAELFRFNTSTCTQEDELVSLAQYVERMRPNQKEIYYLSGENRDTITHSPHLEQFKRKGIEVLYLTEPVDDFLMQDFEKFQDKPFVSADQEDIALEGIADKPAETEAPKTTEKVDLSDRALGDFLVYLKDTLQPRVSDVRLSKRLSDSPCCLVASKDAPNLGLQKAYRFLLNERYEMPKRILEINPDHVLIRRLAQIYAKNAYEAVLPLCCHQLLDNAFILEGSPLDNRDIVPRTYTLMEDLAKRIAPETTATMAAAPVAAPAASTPAPEAAAPATPTSEAAAPATPTPEAAAPSEATQPPSSQENPPENK